MSIENDFTLLDPTNVSKSNLAGNIISGIFVDTQNRIVFERKENGNIVIGRDIEAGVGIASAQLNGLNQIVVTLTDDSEFNLGSVGGGGTFNGIVGTGYLKEINGLTLTFIPLNPIGDASITDTGTQFRVGATNIASSGGMNYGSMVEVIEHLNLAPVSAAINTWVARPTPVITINSIAATLSAQNDVILPPGKYFFNAEVYTYRSEATQHGFRLVDADTGNAILYIPTSSDMQYSSINHLLFDHFELTTTTTVRFEQYSNAIWNNTRTAAYVGPTIKLQYYKL